MVLRIRKKGILILPKRLREAAGMGEGDEVIVEAGKGVLVVKLLKPRIVDIPPSLVEKLLSEEYELERRKYEEACS